MRLLQLRDYIRAYIARNADPDWHHGRARASKTAMGVAAIQRLTRVWIKNHGLLPFDVYTGKIVKETWSADQIGELVDEMAGIPHKSGLRNSMRTDEPPRFVEFPLVVVRSQDKEFFIDGRRRANVWRHRNGRYPVLIIEVVPQRATNLTSQSRNVRFRA